MTGSADWGTVAAPEGGILGVFSRSEEQPIRVSGFADGFVQFEGSKTYAEWVFLGAFPASQSSRAPFNRTK